MHTRLIKLTSLLLGVLSLQFIFGMIGNLYVEFPKTKNQALLWHAAWVNWAVASHMILGTIIVVLGLVIVIWSRRQTRLIRGLALTGWLALLIAASGGEEFVKTQAEVYSLVMALGFIAAMGIYGRLLALLQRQTISS